MDKTDDKLTVSPEPFPGKDEVQVRGKVMGEQVAGKKQRWQICLSPLQAPESCRDARHTAHAARSHGRVGISERQASCFSID